MKRILTLAMAAALLASLTACGSNANAASSDYVYGQIDSVSGNDIVLLLAEYHEKADSESADSAADSKSDKRSGDSKREKPEGFSKPKRDDADDASGDDSAEKSGRKKPEGFDKSGFSSEMPEDFDPSNLPEGFDKSKFSGEKPEGFTKPENGEMPADFDPSNLPERFEKPADGEMPEGFDKSKFGGSRSKSSGTSSYTLTGEQEELRIAIGTTVTTALGVETDFEVLKSGDMIKCTVEKDSDGNDVINAVWIMEE